MVNLGWSGAGWPGPRHPKSLSGAGGCLPDPGLRLVG